MWIIIHIKQSLDEFPYNSTFMKVCFFTKGTIITKVIENLASNIRFLSPYSRLNFFVMEKALFIFVKTNMLQFLHINETYKYLTLCWLVVVIAKIFSILFNAIIIDTTWYKRFIIWMTFRHKTSCYGVHLRHLKILRVRKLILPHDC